MNRVPAEARITVVTTVMRPQSGTGILTVSVSDTDTSLTHHRLEACATLIIPPEEVREKFRRVKPLKDISVTQRGWTLDVLNIVRRLTEEKRQRAGALQDASRNSQVAGTRVSVLDCGGPPPLSDGPEFTTADAYAFTRELEKLHPDNPVNNNTGQAGISAITP